MANLCFGGTARNCSEFGAQKCQKQWFWAIFERILAHFRAQHCQTRCVCLAMLGIARNCSELLGIALKTAPYGQVAILEQEGVKSDFQLKS